MTGSGQPTTATIIFLVADAAGIPISGALVNFFMVGPGGGTYIGPPGDGSPATATGTTDGSGNVPVILNSGTAPGPATITASVTSINGTFSASSSVISIGGAVPSEKHLDLAAVRLNLPGLAKVGFTTNVSAFVADRFGNFNILQGTQVSFFTEAGAIDTSQSTDASGIATVVLRTQNPAPVPVAAPPQANGWVTVIAVVRGEESFVDTNGNGIYDVGEPFTDGEEPYIDANDNGMYDVGEQFVDTNQNGVHDGPHGVWDGPTCSQPGWNASPNIWTSLHLAFTGNIVNCTITPNTINVPDGGSQTFTFSVSDANGNAPGPGTSITFSASAGTLQGQTSFTLPDIVGGPYTGSVTLADAALGDPTAAASLTMTVTSSDVVPCSSVTINGTLN